MHIFRQAARVERAPSHDLDLDAAHVLATVAIPLLPSAGRECYNVIYNRLSLRSRSRYLSKLQRSSMMKAAACWKGLVAGNPVPRPASGRHFHRRRPGLLWQPDPGGNAQHPRVEEAQGVDARC